MMVLKLSGSLLSQLYAYFMIALKVGMNILIWKPIALYYYCQSLGS